MYSKIKKNRVAVDEILITFESYCVLKSDD